MNKLFVIICALLAGFVSISGIAAARTPRDYIFQLVFLPVTSYLAYSVFKPTEVAFSDKKTAIAVVTAGFVILVGLGVLRILQI